MRTSCSRGTGVASSSSRRTVWRSIPRADDGLHARAPSACGSAGRFPAGRSCLGVDDLHALDQEPQSQPDFRDEAHGEPGVADRGVVRQQQGLEEPDQDGDPVEHQEDAQEPGKEAGLVDQVAEREQPRAEEQLGRDPARLVDVDGQVRQPLELRRRVGLHVAGRVSLEHARIPATTCSRPGWRHRRR